MSELMRATVGDNPGNYISLSPSTDGGTGVEFYKDEVSGKDKLRLTFAGDRQTVWDQPVREQDKIRFAREWQLYQEGKDQTHGQTLLENFSALAKDRGSIEVYKALHIRSVEQLANVSDTNMGNMPPGHVSLAMRHREMARKFIQEKAQTKGFDEAIQAARDSQAVASEALEENATLKEQLEELRRKIEDKPSNGSAPEKDGWPKVEKLAGPKTTYRLSDGQIIEGKKRAHDAQALLDAED